MLPTVEWVLQLIAGPIVGAAAALVFGAVRDCRTARRGEGEVAAELAMEMTLALRLIETLEGTPLEDRPRTVPQPLVPRGAWWAVGRVLAPRLTDDELADIRLFYRNAEDLDRLGERLFQIKIIAGREPECWVDAAKGYWEMVRGFYLQRKKFHALVARLEKLAKRTLPPIRRMGR